MALNPIEVTESIRDYYLRYLRTIFPIQDEELACKFRQELESERLIKGPYLEATPGYSTGKSVSELISEGVLHPAFEELDHEDHLPLNRPLYVHQERAIRKTVAEGRNLVIATGTGSGKTEAFLIPILDHLFREREAGTLGPGVRALLLYPMNALANDQVKRLRQILSRAPELTFGRYIGQTPHTEEEAEANFQDMFPGEPRIPNELISREAMLNTPPHILLTNYAMLEYLLLRPHEHVFFAQEQGMTWRFLVLDEAHIYTGAKGTEMGYLLRRLKERVAGGERGRLRCIATSATLGGGSEDYPALAEFASQLFDESFDYLPEDESRQDVVEAVLEGNPCQTDCENAELWEPEPDFYLRLQALTEAAEPDVESFLAGENIPPRVRKSIENAKTLTGKATVDSRDADSVHRLDGFLYALLRHDSRLRRLREGLTERPLDLGEASRIAFPEAEDNALPALTSLVELSCRAKGDRRLLPARYHLFVRAVEGAYVALLPGYRVFLRRRKILEEKGDSWRVFEMAVCENCGSHFLAGKIEGTCSNASFGEAPLYDIGDEDEERAAFFYILPEKHTVVPDEDELEGEGNPVAGRHRLLCGKCGTLSPEGARTVVCGCGERAVAVKGLLLEKGSKVKDFCPRCSAPVTSIRRFVSRQDPSCAVLGTAFYQSTAREQQDIPDGRNTSEGSLIAKPEDDLWSFDFHAEAELPDERRTALKRYVPSRLLAFSDNRQDAAFFACFFEESYMRFLRRMMIAQTVSSQADEMIEASWGVGDLADQLSLLAEEHDLFPRGMTRREKKVEARKWVMAELLRVERRNNLEELGFLAFEYDFRGKVKGPPEGFTKSLGLNDEKALDVLCVLLNSMREQGAVKFLDGLDPKDEYFYPKNREVFFRLHQRDAKKRIASWVPSAGRSNKRLDFLMRLMEKLHGTAEEKLCREILEKLWQTLTHDRSPFIKHGYMERYPLREEGHVFRLDPRIFRVLPGDYERGLHWFRCDKCGKLTTLNVLDLCPSTFRCPGRLKPCNPHEELAENHYYRLCRELKPIPMKVEEHTAQLTARRAGELQQQFVKGEIQVLSCSTTFELGVDVGELEAAFLRNIPPKPANYIQRAGRAGRRTSSVAYILTYVPLRSHDLYYFREPLEMVAGKVKPPIFYLENEKIARRHLHSLVLASFLRDHREYFGAGKVQDFFVRKNGEKKGLEALRDYLGKEKAGLENRLKLIFHGELAEDLGLKDSTWMDYLVGEEGVLTLLDKEINEDLRSLEEIRQKRIERDEYADRILSLKKTIKEESLIDRLAKSGIIPKYGFPVDVVELKILGLQEKARHIELQRDLRIAIAEYAPGGKVIAGGLEWSSYAIKRQPEREWETFHFAACRECGMLHRQRTEESDENPFMTCQSCGKELSPGRGSRFKGAYLIPRFGFTSPINQLGREPGLRKPSRRFITHVYYLPEKGLLESERTSLTVEGKARLRATYVPRSRLAVLSHTTYSICKSCGYGIPVGERASKEHKTAYGRECNGTLQRFKLGHEFLTDVVYIEVETGVRPREDWLSFLYAVLEGAARGLGVDRSDLDGCLYPRTGVRGRPAVILFDNVPGGAGHCRELATNKDVLLRALQEGKRLVEDCECSPESSCYSCLRDYSNQYYHLELSRGAALEIFNLLDL